MSKRKNDFDLEKYREHIVTSLTILKADVRNTKETLIDLRSLLREQNGRIRKNETSLGWMKGVMSFVVTVFSGIIAWLLNK